MKKLLLLFMLVPCSLIAQKKSSFFYAAPGYFAGSGHNNSFMPVVGYGIRNKIGSIGGALYYTTNFSASANLDFRLIHSTTKKSDPFITVQPGISFYKKSYQDATTKGGFDLKAGIGVISNNSRGIHLCVGYYTFKVKTTTTGGERSGSLEGIFISAGLKF